MTSRLVLGAAGFGKLTRSEVSTLLGTALECGIIRIDTAHGYEGSEERIGRFLKTNNQFEVNSKVGLPDPSIFTPVGIRLSVEDSLRRLGIEQLGTLFVHSLHAKYLTDENIEAMCLLRKQGKIKKLGYAGDGNNLSEAVKILSISDFMFTFNIIDQSNFEVIQRAPSNANIYYKLAMGQAIWTSLKWSSRIKSNKLVRFLFGKPPVPETWADYCIRFNQFRSEIDDEDYSASFLRFALFSGSAKQFVVLGTHSQQHIRDAVEIEQEQMNPKALEIVRYEELWTRKSSPTWKAHNG